MQYFLTSRCPSFAIHVHQNKLTACTSSAGLGVASIETQLSKQGHNGQDVTLICG